MSSITTVRQFLSCFSPGNRCFAICRLEYFCAVKWFLGFEYFPFSAVCVQKPSPILYPLRDYASRTSRKTYECSIVRFLNWVSLVILYSKFLFYSSEICAKRKKLSLWASKQQFAGDSGNLLPICLTRLLNPACFSSPTLLTNHA